MWSVRIIGIIVLLSGAALVYFINRRRFNRKAMTGLQMFNSYEHALTTTFAEKIGKLLAWLMIIAGIVLLVISF